MSLILTDKKQLVPSNWLTRELAVPVKRIKVFDDDGRSLARERNAKLVDLGLQLNRGNQTLDDVLRRRTATALLEVLKVYGDFKFEICHFETSKDVNRRRWHTKLARENQCFFKFFIATEIDTLALIGSKAKLNNCNFIYNHCTTSDPTSHYLDSNRARVINTPTAA